MQIPIYTAKGAATTSAPGKSLNVRMNAQPFVQAELAKGGVVQAAAGAVGEYAATRYKIITENNLNKALLGAEESLRTRAYELSKSNDYGKILDGDDPIWNRDVESMRETLRDGVGKDRYALQQFDSRFNQLELTQRFALRGEIDRKIAAAASASRTQNLERFADTVANGDNIAAVDLAARSIGLDSKRWEAVGAGNYEALTKQEYTALKSGTYRAIQKLVDNARAPERVLDNLRSAVRDDDITRAGGEGIYAYGLLQRLPYSDRQQILGSLGSDVAFFNAPTEEEKAAARMAEATGKAAGVQADALMGQLSSGVPVPQEAVVMAREQLNASAEFMTPEAYSAAERKVSDLELNASIAQTLNRVSNPDTISSQIQMLKSGGLDGDGVSGIDTDRERSVLKFLTSYEANMRSAIDNGGILDWSRNTGAVPVGNVDMSVSAIANGQSGLAQRNADRVLVSGHYGISQNNVPVFGKDDASKIVEQFQSYTLEESLAAVATMRNELGQSSQRAFEDLRAAGLPAEYVEMMYQSSPIVQRELIQIAPVDLKELKKGVDTSVATDISNELSASLADYRTAFTAGGNAEADKIFNEQFNIAEKLSLYRARRTGDSAANSVEDVISDLFPPESNWINSRGATLVVPKDFNGREVEAALGAFTKESYLISAGVMPLDNPALPEFADKALAVKSLVDNGIWLNNDTGDGAILHYNIAGSYIPALANQDGSGIRPLEIKFADAPSIYEAWLDSAIANGGIAP